MALSSELQSADFTSGFAALCTATTSVSSVTKLIAFTYLAYVGYQLTNDLVGSSTSFVGEPKSQDWLP